MLMIGRFLSTRGQTASVRFIGPLVGLPDPRGRRVHIWLDPRDCAVFCSPNHGDQ
jgi:hypothetical protein